MLARPSVSSTISGVEPRRRIVSASDAAASMPAASGVPPPPGNWARLRLARTSDRVGGRSNSASQPRNASTTALLLSRQTLPAQVRSPEQVLEIRRGGYVLSDRTDAVAVILATGSEVSLAMAAQQLLDERGIAARVVSLPSSTEFDRQDPSYRDGVLGRGLTRIGVEGGVTRWWGQYGCSAAMGVDTFGESAPAPQVYEHFGLTATNLANLVQAQCDEERRHLLSSN
jgi:transketolase